jgi:lipoprotein NlpD
MRQAAWLAMALVAVLVAGCASRPSAPVVERPPGSQAPAATQLPAAVARAQDQRPESYTVKRGDTLYGIALDHGLDYRELAEWNGISNPNMIHSGDVLRVRPPPVAAAPMGAAQVKPIVGTGQLESRPLSAAAGAAASGASSGKADAATIARVEPRPVEAKPRPESAAPLAKPEAAPATAAKPEAAPAARSDIPGEEDEKVEWAWPLSGKIVARFSEPASKGVDIATKLGDAVHASAPGRVVYSGTGLRGYGKLIIIKHNPTYLSAYAHNNQLLVKEGQNVTKGQKIAEAGATDTDAPKLHFEIRRLGKPVDPLKFLPERSS